MMFLQNDGEAFTIVICFSLLFVRTVMRLEKLDLVVLFLLTFFFLDFFYHFSFVAFVDFLAEVFMKLFVFSFKEGRCLKLKRLLYF